MVEKSCVTFIVVVDLVGNIKTLMTYCGIQLHGEILMKFELHNLDKNLMQFKNMTENLQKNSALLCYLDESGLQFLY